MNNDKKETMKVDNGAYGVKTVGVDLPSNSHKNREQHEEKEEPKKVEKVISGRVIQRKKSFGKKLVETFIGDDIHTVTSYIIYDVIIPSVKAAIVDTVQGGIEMLILGERKGTRTQRDRGRSFVNYNGISTSIRRDDRDRRDMSYRNRAAHNFDELIMSSRGEAEEVLSNLVDLIIDYGQATISDFYDLVGVTANFTDNKYGWVDLSSASVSRVRDGYMINLPKAILLD